jgi:predicted nucleic acid-binding Zn ribbon protein
MPTYVFRNTETNEIFEKIMKISDYDQYNLDNPTHERYHNTAPSIGDPVRLGVTKKDTGFKEVLQRVHEKTPGSQLNNFSSQI